MSQGISQYMSWICPWDATWLVTVWQVDEKKPFFFPFKDVLLVHEWHFFSGNLTFHFYREGPPFVSLKIIYTTGNQELFQ